MLSSSELACKTPGYLLPSSASWSFEMEIPSWQKLWPLSLRLRAGRRVLKRIGEMKGETKKAKTASQAGRSRCITPKFRRASQVIGLFYVTIMIALHVVVARAFVRPS